MKETLPLQKEPVAIIGMSGLFAGSENVAAFWENIVAQADCISEVPASRWNIADYYDPDPATADKTYSKVGGFIPEIDFDPLAYGLPPNILEVTDSSQVLALVMASQALQDAGYEGSRFTPQIRKDTGVILGVGGGLKLIEPLNSRLQYPIWRKVLAHYGLSEETIEEAVEKMKLAYVGWQENAFPGFLSNVIAGRIANRFDLGGTNCVVDAACAASLSAIKMSIQELVEHRCDMMISGGVDTDNTPMAYLSFSKTPAFSKKNQIRPFDAQADGIVIGEGLGMVVLKRLADAERDGDTIYAVIRGIGSSSDGRNASIYAPVSEGQQLAMNRAYQEAGYTPDTVGLVEAHGTGTPTGDRVEFHSLSAVFKSPDAATQTIALGSVKSQIGHTKTAAGAASMIKAALALHHKVLPPTINISKPNPDFKIAESPFYLNTELRPWIQQKKGLARRAGVSAFGFGGTNFHLTLEEYEQEHRKAYRRWSPYRTAVVYADSEEALAQRLQQLLDDVEKTERFEPLPLPSSIPAQARRLGFVYQTKTELLERLRTSVQLLQKIDLQKPFDHPQGISYSPQGGTYSGKIAVLFSGQGTQYVGMGSKLACLYPEFRTNFQQADRIMERLYQRTLSDKVYPPPAFDEATTKEQQALLTQTQFAQPAIGVISMSMYQLLLRQGLKPDMAAGHSFGELTALWAAGVLQEEHYLEMACIRGQMMAQAAKGRDTGGMLAVQTDKQTAFSIIKNQQLGLEIANVNAPNQVVLGGATEDVERAATVFMAHQLPSKVLPVSAAFHTQRLKEAQQDFADFIDQVPFQRPGMAVFSNIDGQAYPNAGATIQQKYKAHMLSTVEFQKEIEAMYSAGARLFIEIGPRNILSNLVQHTLQNQPFKTISLNPNPEQDSARQYQQALMQLLVWGISLDAKDPYALSSPDTKVAKPKMNISFNASNYVSEKTKKQWERALQDSSPKTSEPNREIPPTESKDSLNPVSYAPPLPLPKAEVLPEPPARQETLAEGLGNKQQIASLPILQKQIGLVEEMIQFHAQQQQALEAHRRFLQKYKQQTDQLAEEQQDGNITPPSAFPEAAGGSSALDKSLSSFRANGNGHPSSNDQHAFHGPFASQKSAAGKDAQKNTASLGRDSGLKSHGEVTKADIEAAVLVLIADKTGYPAEMIDLDMELVADLGIDSIKQVEIFGAMREAYPVLQQWQTADFAQLKSLRDIVAKVIESIAPLEEAPTAFRPDNGSSTAAIPAGTPPAEQKGANEVPQEKSLNGSAFQEPKQHKPLPSLAVPEHAIDGEAVVKTMLAIVADKTGYPVEMIDLDMELVADLGIDSIKQVEIFGAMREAYPVFQHVQAEQLSVLKKISDIKKLLPGAQ